MQDADLFMELAAIAGVFVGFAALIAVRGAGASGALEVGYMRGIVGMGLLTVVAALAPVTLGRYGLADHEVWVASSVLVLVGYIVFVIANARTPEYRANWAAGITTPRPRWVTIVESVAYVVYLLIGVLAPIVVVLGLAPDIEAALYFTVVVWILLGAAWLLLELVYEQHGSAEA